MSRLAELSVLQEDLDSAASLAAEACEKAELTDKEAVAVVASCARGKVALARADVGVALDCLLRTEGILQRTRHCFHAIEVFRFLGKAYDAGGQRRFASLFFGKALDAVEQVTHLLGSERNRSLFLSDPRRTALFREIRAFRSETERGLSDPLVQR